MRKQLPPTPSLESLKNQAKQLLKAHRDGDPDACSRIEASFPRLNGNSETEIHDAAFSLRDAQLVIAREYGFPSWPKMVAVLKIGENEPQPADAENPVLKIGADEPQPADAEDDGSFAPIPNPYITGNPVRSPEMFFGREDDFASMREVLGRRFKRIVVDRRLVQGTDHVAVAGLDQHGQGVAVRRGDT